MHTLPSRAVSTNCIVRGAWTKRNRHARSGRESRLVNSFLIWLVTVSARCLLRLCLRRSHIIGSQCFRTRKRPFCASLRSQHFPASVEPFLARAARLGLFEERPTLRDDCGSLLTYWSPSVLWQQPTSEWCCHSANFGRCPASSSKTSFLAIVWCWSPLRSWYRQRSSNPHLTTAAVLAHSTRTTRFVCY